MLKLRYETDYCYFEKYFFVFKVQNGLFFHFIQSYEYTGINNDNMNIQGGPQKSTPQIVPDDFER